MSSNIHLTIYIPISSFLPTKKTLAHLEIILHLDIPDTLPHHHFITTFLQHPHLLRGIPHTQIPPPQRELHHPLLPGLQPSFLKPAQSLRDTAVRDSEVQLRDLSRGDVAGILNCGRDGREDVVQRVQTAGGSFASCIWGSEGAVDALRLRDGEIRIRKRRVRQTVAEFISRRDVMVDEVAVVDIHAFGEIRLGVLRVFGIGIGWVEEGAVVGFVFGDGVGEAAGGGLPAVEDFG